MGLDQYFELRANCKLNPISTDNNCDTYHEMYFRKHNALHAWLIRDDHKDPNNPEVLCIAVTFGSLRKLHKVLSGLVSAIKEQKNGTITMDELIAKCKNEYPTNSGFFFGSTEYNNWYFDDVQDDYNAVNSIVTANQDAKDDEIALDYRVSW